MASVNPGVRAGLENLGHQLNSPSTPAGNSHAAAIHALLTGGYGNFSQPAPPKANAQGQSVISRILDVLSRPQYALANMAVNEENAKAQGKSNWDAFVSSLHGGLSGLAGTEKNTWADVGQQARDENNQIQKTGSIQGFQQGQAGPPNNWEKATAFGANVYVDPLNVISPTGVVRGIGEKTGLYSVPTLSEIGKKAFNKNVAESTSVPIPTPPVEPRNTLLDINPKALTKAKSISDVVEQKIGQPVAITASHPHINIDSTDLINGKIKTSSLTDAGKVAAKELRSQLVDAVNAQYRGKLNDLVNSGVPFNDAQRQLSKWRSDLMSTASDTHNAARIVARKALTEVGPSVSAALEHNRNWIQEAVKNGIDPQRAIQVIHDVQAGDNYSKALADAVKNSKPFKGAKIGKASDFKNLSADSVTRISRILAPTAGEVMKGIHPTNPGAAINAETLQQVKALNAIKRTGYISRALTTPESEVFNAVLPMAHKAIAARGSYNDLAQTRIWNTVRGRVVPITTGGAAAITAVNERTMKIVAHIEHALESEGIHPVAGDGTPARISDAIMNHSEFPQKLQNFPNRIINEYVNNSLSGAIAKAAKITQDVKAAQPIISKATLAVNRIFEDPAFSDPIKHLISQKTAKGVEKSIVMNTGSTRAAKAGRAIYQAIQDAHVSIPQQAIYKAAKSLTEIVATGKIPDNYNSVIADLMGSIAKTVESDPRSLAEGLGGQVSPSVVTSLVGPRIDPETGFMGLMTTWYGYPDLRQALVAGLGTARTNSARWAKYWSDTFENLKPAQQLEAARVAQGIFNGAGNPEVIKSAQMIQTRMENLFGATGLSDFANKGASVAMRGGLIRDGEFGINAELKRTGSEFRFTNDANAKNMLGESSPINLAEGTNWLHSWKAYKFTGDVTKTFAQIETATFNYMAKKAIFDNIRYLHGTTVADEVRNAQIKGLSFLRGVYFHPEVAQQITRVVRDLYAHPNRTSPMLRTIDNIVRMWKTGVTIYAPSHAIRNGMGDMYNNWIAGVNGVRPYTKAIKVMSSAREDYQQLERLGLYVNQNPMELLNGAAKPGEKILLKTKDGQKLTASQIYMAAHKQGILLDVNHIEDIAKPGILNDVAKFQPFNGKVSAVAHGFVQGMDHFTRLAHFIDGVEKGSGNLKDIFDAAGKQVRKFHPDGMDLTGFERNVLRRVIPFYSWSRKAIPFTIEGMLAKPGKFLVYPKATAALNYGSAANINPGQQFPSDQLFPSWISDNGIGPLGGPGGILDSITGGGNGFPNGYVTASPSIPPIDLLQSYANHPNQGILSGLNPLAKVPIELMQGQHIDTGAPIASVPEYLGEQVPIVSLAQRLTNVGIGGTTAKGQQQGIGNSQNFLNFMTGLKLTNTGQYIKQAQYELHQKQTQQKKTNRENLAAFLNSIGKQ